MRGEVESVFCIKYISKGANQSHKMIAYNAFQAENKAGQLCNKIKSDVEVWHHPSYADQIKLCTLIYKQTKP